MSDIIRLLPDAIANQIAAGEVIQRPASVVKELMENAIDAGADDIQVIVRDAGKALIQVVDNGMGMSPPDARMAFERHATSKIRTAQDLFAIRSMGFRGEALASIAAVAQVELRTRRSDDQVGTRVVIEGSEVKTQEACQHPPGTSISVKNLFFNVPARRKFLKTNPVEFRHLLDEFMRIALANADLAFALHHNDSEIYRLVKGNLRQRIVQVLGKKYNEHLVPVDEETNYVRITGFVGKPDIARKTRGDQYLFVNHRFIKSPYLNHAVRNAFEEMIAPDHHPLYILFLDIDPGKIDINVHPTKQEIKFEDERLIYNYLRVSVRHALGKYSVTPSLDFDQEQAFERAGTPARQLATPQEALERQNMQHWERLFDGMKPADAVTQTVTLQSDAFPAESAVPAEADARTNVPYQLHNTLLVSQIKSGILLVDQQAAHERILYERNLHALKEQAPHTQQSLFPITIEFNPAEAAMFRELLPDLKILGFEIEEFGGETFVVQGAPVQLEGQSEEQVLRTMLAQYQQDLQITAEAKERVAKAMSLSMAIPRGKAIPPAERQLLIDMLFACENPYTSPSGRKCFVMLELDELMKRFM